MEKIQNEAKTAQAQVESSEGQKKVYSKPRLQRFGSVTQLTQAGTHQSAEVSNSGAPNMATQSDRRLKSDIVQIGTHPTGVGLYLFYYKPEFRDAWGHGRQFGVMADEVEPVMPAAVHEHPDGYKTVDYGKLGIRRDCH